MIFGTLNPEKIWHENLTDLSTSPFICGYRTLGNPKRSFSTVLFIHTSDYLCYLRRKQTVIHLPTPPENVTALNCELQNFFIWLKVCCVLSNVGSCGLSSVAQKRSVVMCGKWNVSHVTASVQSDHLLHGSMLPVFVDTAQSQSAAASRKKISTAAAVA